MWKCGEICWNFRSWTPFPFRTCAAADAPGWMLETNWSFQTTSVYYHVVTFTSVTVVWRMILLLTFYLDQIDVSLLTFCSVANILILCSAQFWLGCGGWVALDPFDFSIPSQTSFSLPYLVGGWQATWLVDLKQLPDTWLVFVRFHPRLN